MSPMVVRIGFDGDAWQIVVRGWRDGVLWGRYTAPTLADAIELLRRARRMAWNPEPREHALYYRDRTGKRIGLRQWAALWQDDEYRFLGRDTIGTTRVVTIWNGMYPYSAEPVGPIFSSMVFRQGAAPPGVEYGVEEWHGTEAEALAWHAATVAKLREGAS